MRAKRGWMAALKPATGTEHPMNAFKTRFHRDATITLWDVHTQSWERTGSPSDAQLAAMPAADRERAIRHTGR